LEKEKLEAGKNVYDQVKQIGDELLILKNIETQLEILTSLVRREVSLLQARRINAVKLKMQEEGGGNEDRQ